jgi:hypothetical protein
MRQSMQANFVALKYIWVQIGIGSYGFESELVLEEKFVMQHFRRFVSVLLRVRSQVSLCGFVVDKVVLAQDLLEVLRTSPDTVIRPTIHIQPLVYHRHYVSN